MRLLITTQAVDIEDPVLGFFHRWIEEFAKHCESVEVICLREGAHDLPANVHVHSLGKERGTSRFTRTALFYRYIFSLRNRYDAVYVHMNPEYVVLGGPLWRLWRKRVGLWYNHAARTKLLRIAMIFAHVVFHTSPFAASAGTPKSHIMPAGIDTDVFMPVSLPRAPLSVYYQGRVAPSKRVGLLCDAIRRLRADGLPVTATIVGPEDVSYGKELRERFSDLAAQGAIVFAGPKRNDETPALFASHTVSVNLASRGGLDKTVLESLACATPAVASSDAFGPLVPKELMFKEGDLDSLVATLKRFFAMPEGGRVALAERLRALVIERHSLTSLVPQVLALL